MKARAPKTASTRSDLNTTERLMTIKEVAAFCGVSEKTVRRWIDAGTLSAAKLGAQWRVRPTDLSDFVREGMSR